MKKRTHSAQKSSKPSEAEGKRKKSRAPTPTKKTSAESAWQAHGLDLENYAPAYFTFVATKLASGAAAVYRKHFGVGIEIWRVLVMLALEEKVSVNMVCKLIGMDKGSVSRCFKSMYEKGLITFSHDPLDGRVRYATLTAAGRRKHDEIKAVALAREQAFLSCLQPEETVVLIDMLHRLHANLPQVEEATQQYLRRHVTQTNRR